MFVVGIGLIAGLLLLKNSLDSRSRATDLICREQTSITCVINPQNGMNLDDYVFDVQVVDESVGVNTSVGSISSANGTPTDNGGREFQFTFNAGAGDYVCKATAKLKAGTFCPDQESEASKISSVRVCRPSTDNRPTPTDRPTPNTPVITQPTDDGEKPSCPQLPKPTLTIECRNCDKLTPTPLCKGTGDCITPPQ